MPHASTTGLRAVSTLSRHMALLLLAIGNPLFGGSSASITRKQTPVVGAHANVQRSSVWARPGPILRGGDWTHALTAWVGDMGHSRSHTYETRIEDQLGYCYDRLYHTAKLVVAYRDRASGLRRYTYASMGGVRTEVNPLGATSIAERGSFGNLISCAMP